jgi:hypothetical protein
MDHYDFKLKLAIHKVTFLKLHKALLGLYVITI